jgi:uncharacterized Zn-binding protein involved in type VI secretion
MPPAARLADPTTHGAPLAPGPGSLNVVIGGQPAWRTTVDQHACPAVSISGADGVGSVLVGSITVMINGQMACRQGDIVVEKPGLALGPADPIMLGCLTVIIGDVPTFGLIINGVNPSNSVINCGNIVDAVIDRLSGTNDNATAPNQQDGTFDEIAQRHGTNFQWGHSFQDAFDAVQRGGNGTTALIGIQYSGGTASHIVTMTNYNGHAVILEGQDWGAGNPRETITTPDRANQRYNSDGWSNMGIAVLPPAP